MGGVGGPGSWGGEYAGAWHQGGIGPLQDTPAVNPDWVAYPFEDLHTWSPLKWLQPPAGDRQATGAASPLLVGLLVGLLYTASILVSTALNPAPRPKLQSHDMCGLTTGGQVILSQKLTQTNYQPQDECFWDCEVLPGWAWTGWFKGETAKNQVIKNLDCLRDCFSPKNVRNDNTNSDPSCITSLLEDVISKGTCEWKGGSRLPIYAPAWPQPESWGLSDM